MDNSSQLYNKMKKVVVWSRLPEEEGLLTYYGAGVVIDDRGYILTCAHLVPEGLEVTVRRSDDDAFQEAYVLHRSGKEDLAIRRIRRAGQYEFSQFGDTRSIQMGMPVFALIHANKVEFSFAAGDVICPERPKEQIPLDLFFNFSDPGRKTFFQINSLHCSSCSHGAPVFDSTGKVLGLIAVTAGFDFATCGDRNGGGAVEFADLNARRDGKKRSRDAETNHRVRRERFLALSLHYGFGWAGKVVQMVLAF